MGIQSRKMVPSQGKDLSPRKRCGLGSVSLSVSDWGERRNLQKRMRRTSIP